MATTEYFITSNAVRATEIVTRTAFVTERPTRDDLDAHAAAITAEFRDEHGADPVSVVVAVAEVGQSTVYESA